MHVHVLFPLAGRALLGVLAGAALGWLLLATAPAAAAAGREPSAVWPLPGQVREVRGFDPPAQRWSAGHRGVDLLGPIDAVVRAAVTGTVSFAGPLAGRGVVTVTHADGTRTTYEPVTAAVTVGQVVRTGATLGRLAGAPSHCRPRACLHWGWRRDEAYLDPRLLFGGGPVRLLPVWSGPSGAAGGSTPRGLRAGSAQGSSRSRLVVAGSAGLPLLAAGAGALAARAVVVRRRSAQSRAGRAVARRA